MTKAHPFIQQIDHVGIYTPQPRQLFDFFHETLGLPVAFPYREYAGYHSGCVALGNCYLEIMRLGAAPDEGAAARASRFFILGFLDGSRDLETTRSLLKSRRVRHSGIIPFFAPEATDKDPQQLWANVYLGDLLGANVWMRLFFFLSRYAEPRPSDMESRALSAMTIALLKRAFRRGMPVLTTYFRFLDEHRAAISPDMLRENGGGVPGLLSATEIEVGVPDMEVWRRFLAPVKADDRGRVRLGAGPALKLLPHDRPGILALSLRVASLPEAEEALRSLGLAVQREGQELALTLPQSGGLAVRFVG